MKKTDLISAIIFLIIGILTILLSLNMDIGTFQNAGTGLFPLILGIILTILSVIYLLKYLIASRKNLSAEKKTVNVKPESEQNKKKFNFAISDSVKQLVLTFSVLLFAAAFLNLLGFLLTSFIVEMALLKILKMKNWIIIIIASISISVFSYILFVIILNINLPKGFLGI